MTQLTELITDLYFYEALPPASSFTLGSRGALIYCGGPKCIPVAEMEEGDERAAVESWINRIADAVKDQADSRTDFRVVSEGRPYRALRSNSCGRVQVGLRRLPERMPMLEELSIRPQLLKLLSHEWLNDGGLVLFSGLTGQGKTTVAAASVPHRLRLFGGRALVVEDVQEMPMEGVWGMGSCRQLEVDYHAAEERDAGFSGAIRQAYRSMPATRPAILYIGEVRDTETAVEVVQAAANGMLVISTLHAVDGKSALMRLVSLAEKEMGEAAASTTADALRMVVHQSMTLSSEAPPGWERAKYNSQILVSGNGASPVANNIRKRTWEQMAGIASQQRLWLEGKGVKNEADMMNKLRGIND